MVAVQMRIHNQVLTIYLLIEKEQRTENNHRLEKIACRWSTAKETKNGPHDDGAPNGIQNEVLRPDPDHDRWIDPPQGHRVARWILLRPVRCCSRAESALTGSFDIAKCGRHITLSQNN